MNSRLGLLTIICVLIGGISVFAQTKARPKAVEDDTRGIVAEEFLKSRPAKSGSNKKRLNYRRASAKTSLNKEESGDFAQVGLTVWRLRPAKNDEAVRIVVHEGEDSVAWTPVRVNSFTPLPFGERVRFSFESPREGYLYVIDREQYADGSYGEPYLIFPTTRTRGGENLVAPGRIVEVPGQEDRPNYFRLTQNRSDQVGESLTVIVTPQPLEGISIGDKMLQLSNDQVAKWEMTWGAEVQRFELADGAGKAWTRSEKEAGEDATRQLTQEDPAPQTIYRVAVKPDQPILVKVGLRYARSTARQSSSRR